MLGAHLKACISKFLPSSCGSLIMVACLRSGKENTMTGFGAD